MAGRKAKHGHGELHKKTITFDVPGSTLVALHNSLAFVDMHSEQYNDEIGCCANCFEAIGSLRRQIADILLSFQTSVSPIEKPLN